MPRFEEAEEPQGQTWEAQLATVEQLNAAFGGRDARPGGTT